MGNGFEECAAALTATAGTARPKRAGFHSVYPAQPDRHHG